MNNKKKQNNSGFTLIEMLVVLSIIMVLATITFSNLVSAKLKAQDARRKEDMTQLKTALELYHSSYGSYPTTNSAWFGISQQGGYKTTSGVNAYIPNLAPTYISILPNDPSGRTDWWTGYLYKSNGNAYKLLNHMYGPYSYPKPGEVFYDPIRPTWAWMICSGDSIACLW